MNRNIKRLTHSEEFSNYYMSVDESEDLEHFGKLGMKWGQRLYQYKDGSLTPLGRVHYGIGSKRAKQMHEKGYTLGDYEGYKSYKKIQKTSSYRDRGWKLKKEAADSYNEDIISDSAKRRASRNYYEDMHRRKPLIMALASKDDKQKISELAEKYANSEDYRRAKEFLDNHKDEFINKPKEKQIDIQDKELSKLSNEAADSSINGENNPNKQSNKIIDDKIIEKESKITSLKYDLEQINGVIKRSEETLKEIEKDEKNYDDFDKQMAIRNYEDFMELKEEVEMELQEVTYSNEFLKNLKDTGEDWNTEESFKNAKPMTKEDSASDPNVYQVMDIYGLKPEDLIINKTPKGRMEAIYRKDGKAFEYNYGTGKGKTVDLLYLAYEGPWVGNKQFKAINGNGDMREKKINRIKSLKKSGKTIEEIAKILNMPRGTVNSYLYYS